MQPAIRDILNGKRPRDPAKLLVELANAYPNDVNKLRNLFFAIIIEDGTLMRACIMRVFDDLITAPPK